ncbi:DUF6760 family protein [Phytohabitans sp. LJ34]|uniref:DUF6760 family protein n=1 Tax=Phytohabitans sp. LJ34 TaxID=3452217 RepID=UPI003F89F398
MPPLCPGPRPGAAGGILGYPLTRVYQEVALLGQRVHWTHHELMNLDHTERRRWLATVLELEETT